MKQISTKEKRIPMETDEPLEHYFRTIKHAEPLSREEEVALSARAKRGDLSARDALLTGSLRYVVAISKEYQNCGLSLRELISAGNVGLVEAANRFDGTKGFKFITYAVWWIRQAIRLALAEETRTVRLPLNRVRDIGQLHRATGKLEQKLHRTPHLREISETLEMTDVELTTALSSSTSSLDELIDDDRTWIDILADETDLQDEQFEVLQVSEKIKHLLRHLTKREATIIIRYYGLGGEEPKTLEVIGMALGITRERVRQLKVRAMETLTQYAPDEVGELA